MTEFHELWDHGPLFADSDHFRLCTDSVLLSDFVPAERFRRGIDLGCGSGAILLLLLTRTQRLHMTGLEILPEAAAVAAENVSRNGLDLRAEILEGDIRTVRGILRSGSFDLVVSNPPYFPAGSGAVPPEQTRAAARGESSCSAEELCAAASYLLKTGGAFCLVHRPERLADLFRAMSLYRLEPKRLRMVQNTAVAAPSLVLIESRSGGRPGLRIDPPLILRELDGSESGEYRRIYRK